MRVNLDGTFHVLRAALRTMVPNRSGAVVTARLLSLAFDTQAGHPHYAASKAGAHALSQSVAKEAIAFGIRVNTVAPGPTETGMAARTPEALRRGFANRVYAPTRHPRRSRTSRCSWPATRRPISSARCCSPTADASPFREAACSGRHRSDAAAGE